MTQTFKGSFSFKNQSITETRLLDDLSLRFEQVGHAIARVYFVNNGGAEVAIPNGFSILDNTNNVQVHHLPFVEYFVLAWMDSYDLMFNGEVVLSVNNQRQWSVIGSRNREVNTIQP